MTPVFFGSQVFADCFSKVWRNTQDHYKALITFFFLIGRYDGILVGDRGYACMPFLMTPYGDPQSESEARFNRALSTGRVRIEMTFGILKARWNCLRGLRVKPERGSQIITACVVLHNIASIRKERAPHVPLVADDVVDPITVDHPTGTAVRRAITNQFFG